MYNLRFTYSNPNAYDRRLTLYADGVERTDPGERYRIPLWLPPTGEGKWAAATLMWTLYDATTRLDITCSRKPDPAPGEKINRDEPDRKPGWDDAADVLIGAVDLVRSEPPSFAVPATPAFPELVKIPGGAVHHGQPDVHRGGRASRSPGEAFGFCHRQIRGDKLRVRAFLAGAPPVARRLFLRDREPVIYVAWCDAARYCNWLSKKAGLSAVYDENTWAAHRKADGFRLPSEAEWEYVATGRGENREYPWGNAPPQPMVHGNFMGAAALDVPAIMRSQEVQGAVVVGSFPKGASRDGVMDLAGNVAQWCGDWYQFYTSGETDGSLGDPGKP